MKPFTPTTEQVSILGATDRLVVVRACPGSGKTAVFAETVRKLSNKWPYPRKGIAALSFTNAASQEIFDRVGSSLLPPHFIGTLDSFVLRYVVLSLGNHFGLPAEGARLVPSPLDERLKFSPFRYGSTNREQVPICSVRILGGSIAKPTMDFFDPITRKRIHIADKLIDKAMEMKRKNWRSNGIITHADSHYIAAALLTEHEHRSQFAKLIAKRFPVLLVDEFQDTTWFLSQALLALLNSEAISGLVVGDPDQSIYEFGGAPADLFDLVEQLPGAQKYPMTLTQRFGKNICPIVHALSQSQASIAPASDISPGKAILVIHNLQDKDLTPQFVSGLIDQLNLQGEVALLSRKTKICKRFSVLTNMASFPGGSKLAEQIDDAVFFLRRGDNKKSANIISRELWNLLTDEEGLPTSRELETKGIDRRKWRQSLYSILLECERPIDTETWNEWLSRVKSIFEKVLADFGVRKKLGTLCKTDKKGAPLRVVALSSNDDKTQDYTVLTIHQAKGLQFKNVILFLNKPDSAKKLCVSSQWWGSEKHHLEEKRVGFVAISRPKEILVICMHQESYKSLEAQQPEFIKLFEDTLNLVSQKKQFSPSKKSALIPEDDGSVL